MEFSDFEDSMFEAKRNEPGCGEIVFEKTGKHKVGDWLDAIHLGNFLEVFPDEFDPGVVLENLSGNAGPS